MKKWVKRIFFTLLFFLTILVIIVLYLHPIAFKEADYDHPPHFIEADYIDLSQIETISKYRSAIGHSTDDSVEKCLSLRHIYGSQEDSSMFGEGDEKWNIIHNRPTPENSIDIYAPVNGIITDVSSSSHIKDKQGIAGTIIFKPDNAPGFDVRIDSVFVDPGMHAFKKVKAGEKVGVICKLCPGEITVEYNYIGGRRAVSYVMALSDKVFTEYQKRGMKNREEAVISKEYRDAHPLKCEDPKNETSTILDTPEMQDMSFSYVLLSGYSYPSNELKKDFNKKY